MFSWKSQAKLIGLLVFVLAGVATFAVKAALAQRPKVTVNEGHISPVMVRITYREGKVRDALLVHVGVGMNEDSHQLSGTGDGGARVRIWLDTIRMIQDTSDKEFTVVSKDGKERVLEPIYAAYALTLANPDDSTESVAIKDCKKIEFLKPARKDNRGNAMFDQWKYSPYTGEKLPEE